MSIQLTKKRIRLKADASLYAALVDFKTQSTPRVWRGNDAQLDVAVYFGTSLVDISNLASITVEIMPSTRSGTAIVQETISSSAFNTSLTTDQFEEDTHQHFIIPLTAAQMNQAPESGTEKTFWMVISAITNDGANITIGAGNFVIEEDGTGTAGDPPTPAVNYYSTGQAEALFVRQWATNAGWRFRNGYWEVYFAEDGAWRPLVGVFKDGKPTLGFGEPST